MKRILVLAGAGGVLIALLKLIEYQHFVRAYPTELYGGLIAVIFTIVGIYAGVRLTRRREPVFESDGLKVKELGITPREHEVLGLIAQGLTNKEIGDRLFVSESTIKTHSSRLFEKLDVSRRVQAIQKAKELGLIP